MTAALLLAGACGGAGSIDVASEIPADVPLVLDEMPDTTTTLSPATSPSATAADPQFCSAFERVVVALRGIAQSRTETDASEESAMAQNRTTMALSMMSLMGALQEMKASAPPDLTAALAALGGGGRLPEGLAGASGLGDFSGLSGFSGLGGFSGFEALDGEGEPDAAKPAPPPADGTGERPRLTVILAKAAEVCPEQVGLVAELRALAEQRMARLQDEQPTD